MMLWPAQDPCWSQLFLSSSKHVHVHFSVCCTGSCDSMAVLAVGCELEQGACGRFTLVIACDAEGDKVGRGVFVMFACSLTRY
jgi:hypothetical protein